MGPRPKRLNVAMSTDQRAVGGPGQNGGAATEVGEDAPSRPSMRPKPPGSRIERQRAQGRSRTKRAGRFDRTRHEVSAAEPQDGEVQLAVDTATTDAAVGKPSAAPNRSTVELGRAALARAAGERHPERRPCGCVPAHSDPSAFSSSVRIWSGRRPRGLRRSIARRPSGTRPGRRTGPSTVASGSTRRCEQHGARETCRRPAHGPAPRCVPSIS